MDKIQTNQNSETELPWYKKYLHYIVFGFLAIITGGMYAIYSSKQRPSNIVKQNDDLDKEVIADKIVEANQLDVKIDSAIVSADKVSDEGNDQIKAIAIEANNTPIDKQVTDLNDFMKKRK